MQLHKHSSPLSSSQDSLRWISHFNRPPRVNHQNIVFCFVCFCLKYIHIYRRTNVKCQTFLSVLKHVRLFISCYFYFKKSKEPPYFRTHFPPVFSSCLLPRSCPRASGREGHVQAEEGHLLPHPDALLHHVSQLLPLLQPADECLLEQFWTWQELNMV